MSLHGSAADTIVLIFLLDEEISEKYEFKST